MEALDGERGRRNPAGRRATRLRVIEDAPARVEAAQAAGMPVIGITTTFARRQLACELCIDDFLLVTVRAV